MNNMLATFIGYTFRLEGREPKLSACAHILSEICVTLILDAFEPSFHQRFLTEMYN
jgi:hypothetical protein